MVDYSATGDQNFTVDYHGGASGGRDQLVNDIGPVTGTGAISHGPLAVMINAVGPWSLTSDQPDHTPRLP